MEIFILVLLYYLSQNPDFHESIKPIMDQLKSSERMLSFLNDLSKFTQTFSTFQSAMKTPPSSPTDNTPTSDDKGATEEKQKTEEKEQPQSPTAGIADAFIQNILEGYLNKR